MKCLVCASEKISPFPEGEAEECLKCWVCGLVWVRPQDRPEPEREMRRYLQHNNSLDEPAYLRYLSRAAAAVKERMAPGSHGLDFGCGPVEGMKFLLEPHFRIDSYDPIFFPRENLLKFRYDFVLCIEAAEHFHDPAKEFSRIDSLLRPGGLLAVSSLLLPPPEEFARWHYRRDYTHVCFYGEETVRWLATRFNWRLLNLESPYWLLQKN